MRQTEEHGNPITNLKMDTPAATSKDRDLSWTRLQKATSCAQIRAVEGFAGVALSVTDRRWCNSHVCFVWRWLLISEIWKGTAAAPWGNAHDVTGGGGGGEKTAFLGTMENGGHLGGVRGHWGRGEAIGICRPRQQSSFVLKLSSSCWSKSCYFFRIKWHILIPERDSDSLCTALHLKVLQMDRCTSFTITVKPSIGLPFPFA